MVNEQSRSDAEFVVLCVSCGVEMGKSSSEDSRGLCLSCFYRILGEKLLSQPRTFAGEFVSER